MKGHSATIRLEAGYSPPVFTEDWRAVASL